MDCSSKYKSHFTNIPPADGHPGLELGWEENCQPAIDDGIACAERWLASSHRGYLWTALILGREQQQTAIQYTAFEVGFLTRLQQWVMREAE